MNNLFGDQAFLPYSVGMLAAYARRDERLRREFEFKPFIHLREPIGDVVRRMDHPDVLGLSCYVWNWEYSKRLARAVRSAYPDCLIVAGGPHVPLHQEDFFIECPYVDITVHHEGEITFADILRESLAGKPDFAGIPGVSIPTADGRRRVSPPRPRTTELDELPSPYLDGVFDDLIALPYRWNASQETTRGCPYSCTFCDWGSSVYTKVRTFSDARIAEELEWFGRNEIEILYNCDANYGILPRDLELTRTMAQVKRETGYPRHFRPAFAKQNNARVFEIAKILRDTDLQKGVTLSMQSLDDGCLENIKRRNIKDERLAETLRLYRSERIPSYTEIILGLPGESYHSFVAGIDRLFRLGQHDGCFIYLCEVLPNSELADAGYRELHGIRTIHMPLLLGYSTPGGDGDDIAEYVETVVETATMTHEDLCRAYMFGWAAQCFHCLNVTQSLAIFLNARYALPYATFYEQLVQYAMARPETILGAEYSQAHDILLRSFSGHPAGTVVPGFGDVNWYVEEASFLRLMTRKREVFAELRDFIRDLARSAGLDLDDELLDDLVLFQEKSTSDPLSPRTETVDLRYRIGAYLECFLSGAQTELERADRRIRFTAERDYRNAWPEYALDTVRYGRKGGKGRREATELTRPARRSIPRR